MFEYVGLRYYTAIQICNRHTLMQNFIITLSFVIIKLIKIEFLFRSEVVTWNEMDGSSKRIVSNVSIWEQNNN